MNLDFKEIDKQTFSCIQMPDGSIFYGEIEYINLETKELISNYDDLTEDQKKLHKLVRHGYGI